MQIEILKTVLSPAYIQAVIENKYKLDSISHTILIRSSSNDIYKIITKDNQYIFKIFNLNKKLKDLEFEIEYMLYLNKNNILLSFPFKNLSNQYFVYIDYPEGTRIAILTNYIKGKKLTYTAKDAYLYGKNIAYLHKISNLFHITTNKNKEYNISEILLESKMIIIDFLLQYHPKYVNFFLALSNKLLVSIENIKFTQQYCHNDLHSDNAKKVGNNIYFYDFDFSGNGYIMYELAVFKWSCMIGKRIGSWQEFIRGYESILKVNVNELKFLLHFVAIRDIIVMSYYINRVNIIGHEIISSFYIDKKIKFLKNIENQIEKRNYEYE